MTGGKVWGTEFGPVQYRPDGRKFYENKDVCLGSVEEVFARPSEKSLGIQNSYGSTSPPIVSENVAGSVLPPARGFDLSGGRPRADVDLELLQNLRAQGGSIADIQRECGLRGVRLSESMIKRRLKEAA